MKNVFRFMAGNEARWVKGIIGFSLVGWGYHNMYLLIAGTILFLGALFNILIFAPLFGYSIFGNNVIEQYGSIHFGKDSHQKPLIHNKKSNFSDKLIGKHRYHYGHGGTRA
ncbi:MAG: hypothetical protein ACTHJ0_03015 [Flavipsychrobacter sp.]